MAIWNLQPEVEVHHGQENKENRGTLDIRAIKAELGTMFVQDPESARYDGMPRAAIDTGLADFILKPVEMLRKLIQFVEHSTLNSDRSIAKVKED
jgi:hypothetical protein